MKWLRSLGMSCNSVVIFQNWWSQRYEEGHQTKAQVGKGKHHIINSVFTSNAHAHVKFYSQFFSYWSIKNKKLPNSILKLRKMAIYRSSQLCHSHFPGDGLVRDHWQWLDVANRPQSVVLWKPGPDRLYDRCLPPLYPRQVSLPVLWSARNRGPRQM